MPISKSRYSKTLSYFEAVFLLLTLAPADIDANSVARTWNEACLEAIRLDIPSAATNARNLFHSSAAAYDAWAAFDIQARSYLFLEKHSVEDVEAMRREAISYAVYRILISRYEQSFSPVETKDMLDGVMAGLGYDLENTDLEGDSPASIGNRIAALYIDLGFNDGSNQANDYLDTTGYQPVNRGLQFERSFLQVVDPNRWQPLQFTFKILSEGAVEAARKDEVLEIEGGGPAETVLRQVFFEPHWGEVATFALERKSPGLLLVDPGPPPFLGGPGDEDFKENVIELIRLQSYLHFQDETEINTGPGAIGNNPLGGNDGTGHPVNPFTGQPYQDHFVKRHDFGRVTAAFWSDGPDSETPPGHWNVIANAVSDHPAIEKRIGGEGPIVSELEWDVKLYFVLNAALHDAGIAAFEIKKHYDYVRPITMIRYMSAMGQSTDTEASNYHVHGMPLIDGLIEVISADSSARGERHDHLTDRVGEIAVKGKTHLAPEFTLDADIKGHTWTLGKWWMPFQEIDFVTPSFAGYVSGHSTFSRAAAEALAGFTGSEFFPGGLFEFPVQLSYLAKFDRLYEIGPSEPFSLQWATYFDASDAAGRARLWGGIHVEPDDLAGRIVGSEVGRNAWAKAKSIFNGEKVYAVQSGPSLSMELNHSGKTQAQLTFHGEPESYSIIYRSKDLMNWEIIDNFLNTGEPSEIIDELTESPAVNPVFYRALNIR